MAWIWALLLSLPPALFVLASGPIDGALVAVALPLVGIYYFGAGALAGWISGQLEGLAAAGSALSIPVLLGAESVLGSGDPPSVSAVLVSGYLASLGGLAVRLAFGRLRVEGCPTSCRASGGGRALL